MLYDVISKQAQSILDIDSLGDIAELNLRKSQQDEIAKRMESCQDEKRRRERITVAQKGRLTKNCEKFTYFFEILGTFLKFPIILQNKSIDLTRRKCYNRYGIQNSCTLLII